jgi:uncharacterized protein YjbI with pentapeptide repeats
LIGWVVGKLEADAWSTKNTSQRKGANAWNDWRASNPDVLPDLAGADLSGAKLTGFDLTYLDLGGAILRGADLDGALLIKAHLDGADLSRAL